MFPDANEPGAPATPVFSAPDDLPHPWGAPTASGVARSVPEDFQVDEIPAFTPSGEGEHVLLHLRKRGRNTEDVARQLASLCHVPMVAVGYAGLKDRDAVTSQWFSVQLPGKTPEPDWQRLESPELQLLDRVRHHKKIRRGVLAGNRFILTLRQWRDPHHETETRLARIAEQGVPNYFGPQRFGHANHNLHQALALFRGQRRKLSRHKRGLYLSAARSFLFNTWLADRVRQGNWDRLEVGDVAQLDGSHSVFPVTEVDSSLTSRLREQDLHPTGPLWGRGTSMAQGTALAGEESLAREFPEFCQGLEAAGMEAERRPTRLKVTEPMWESPAPDEFRLSFTLPPGGYATTVLREVALLQTLEDTESTKT